ncbi:MAG: polysaccharide deacetylase family protein [Elusimicrobia bacterium]|nr:polysaccharide deacetylase family protein [Elusimicrobiota bacterium]
MSSVPVLIYHHVAPDREVTPAGFERQLEWLAVNGYRTLTADELHAHVTGKARAPERSVALTFDDGYADNWVYAYPALRTRGFTAQVFVITGRIGEGAPRPNAGQGGRLADTITREREPEGFLRWSELSAMSADGTFEIGSHTETHKDFVRERPWADLDGELSRSREAIERRVKRWSGALAWPWGDYEAEWLERVEAAGYRLAFTAMPGANRLGSGGFEVRRFKVQREDLRWFGRRIHLYRSPRLAAVYGRLYGLDRKLKSLVRGRRI